MEKGVVQIGKRNPKHHHQPLQRLYYSFFYYFLRVIKDLTDVEFPLRTTLTQRKRVRERERENIRKLGFFLDEFLVFSRRISPKFINTLIKILSLSLSGSQFNVGSLWLIASRRSVADHRPQRDRPRGRPRRTNSMQNLPRNRW